MLISQILRRNRRARRGRRRHRVTQGDRRQPRRRRALRRHLSARILHPIARITRWSSDDMPLADWLRALAHLRPRPEQRSLVVSAVALIVPTLKLASLASCQSYFLPMIIPASITHWWALSTR